MRGSGKNIHIFCKKALPLIHTQKMTNIYSDRPTDKTTICFCDALMRRQAAAKIDQGIGKQEVLPEKAQETKRPAMTTFRADPGKRRKPGTGCVTQIDDHLWEGRYSPRGPDGKQRSRNVYGHTLEECEEKLKVLIAAMKAEIQAERKQLREAGNMP